ncbi:sigma-54 dependent transcriptional regulator [Myxococcota bacterium]|nr:sigma-54 dependent transcriptional regulator [Myxococcota bacterium]
MDRAPQGEQATAELEPPISVLVVDDEYPIRRAWYQFLNPLQGEFKVQTVEGAEAALALLKGEHDIEVVITDVHMPGGMSGIDLLKHIKQTAPLIEVILMTGFARIEDSVLAMKGGAFDYITKPFPDPQGCVNRVRRAAQVRRMREELIALRRGLPDARPDVLQSKAPSMKRVTDLITRAAKTEIPILITGATGSGKTALAEAIHALSARAQRPFIKVDLTTISPSLFESELFGHARGAFTGAVEEKRGVIELADGGTLFLDEMNSLPLDLQPKLLRLIQEGAFKRVGSNEAVRVDVRLITATNVDLGQEVEAGRFRKDLYFRIKVVEVELPPLRSRIEDLPRLVYTLLKRKRSHIKRVQPDCLERLKRYSWPGNIRELENVLEEAILFEDSEDLCAAALPTQFQDALPQMDRHAHLGEMIDLNSTWKESVGGAEEFIRARYLRGVLERAEGNITQAAKHAGLDRSNFRRLLKKHVPDYSE